MASEQEQAIASKLTQLGYPVFVVALGEDDVSMLYIQDRLICGVLYALSLSDEQLKALIDETVKTPGD